MERKLMTGTEKKAIAKVLGHYGLPLTNESYIEYNARFSKPPDYVHMASTIGKVRCYALHNGKRIKINDIHVTQMIERERAEMFPHHWEIAND